MTPCSAGLSRQQFEISTSSYMIAYQYLTIFFSELNIHYSNSFRSVGFFAALVSLSSPVVEVIVTELSEDVDKERYWPPFSGDLSSNWSLLFLFFWCRAGRAFAVAMPLTSAKSGRMVPPQSTVSTASRQSCHHPIHSSPVAPPTGFIVLPHAS